MEGIRSIVLIFSVDVDSVTNGLYIYYTSINVGLLRNEKNYGREFFICYRINIDISTVLK